MTPPDEKSIDVLLREAASGCDESVSALLERASGLIYYCVDKFTKDPQHREDCFQEASILLLRRLQEGTYDAGRAAFSTWVVHCLYSRGRQLYRSKRRAAAARAGASYVGEGEPANPGASPLAQASYRELREAVRSALSAVEPAHHRMALAWRIVDGLSYTEIARKLNAKPSDVKNWVKRGRAKMRRILVRQGFGPR